MTDSDDGVGNDADIINDEGIKNDEDNRMVTRSMNKKVEERIGKGWHIKILYEVREKRVL